MSNMRLLLIFVLTFTLSTQTDNKDNADVDSMDDDGTETNDNKDNADVDSTDDDGTETNDNKDNADVDSTVSYIMLDILMLFPLGRMYMLHFLCKEHTVGFRFREKSQCNLSSPE
ncbi:uncharacterized protein M6D78_013263 isoform 2-T6 [Vipera latastei]